MKWKIAGMMVAAAMLTGCFQDTVNTVENSEKNMQAQSVDIQKVSTDSFLKGRLKIVRVDKVTLPDGLLKVQVSALNVRTGFFSEIWSWFTNDNPYSITYRFTWLDQNGMEVNTAASTWIPLTVVPGDTIRLSAVSPNSRCKDFVLSLRENN